MLRHRLLRSLQWENPPVLPTVWDRLLTQRLPQSAFDANGRGHIRGVAAFPSLTSTFPFSSGICTGRPDDYLEPPVFPVIMPPELMNPLCSRVQSWKLFFWTPMEGSSLMLGCSGSFGGYLEHSALLWRVSNVFFQNAAKVKILIQYQLPLQWIAVLTWRVRKPV